MKFNLLSGILLVLLIIVLVFAFFQKTEADAARQLAQQNEAIALVQRAEAAKYEMEAKKQEELALKFSDQLAACKADKRK